MWLIMDTKDANKETYWSIPLRMWMLFGIASALLMYAFLEPISVMVQRWNTSEEYGYGYIIPLITIFLIWQRKDQLLKSDFHPTYWALPVLVFSGLLYFIGAISATHTLSQYALVLTILALAYGFLGWKKFKIIAIPIALLFFMVPLPAFIFNNLSAKLQLISSEIGVFVVRLFGISVYLEGNVIDLGVYKLQVVEACSGLRYLFPLVSLSFIAAYLYNVEMWKRVVVFLSSIPITVLMNSFRIGVIGVLVEHYGIEQAEGFLHDFEGWIIFMACMGILFIEMAVLARIGKNKKHLADVFAIDFPEPVNEDCNRRENRVTLVNYVLVASLVLYGISTLYVQKGEDVVLDRSEFYDFPDKLENWTGRKEKLDPYIEEALNTDDYIVSDYINSNGDIVNFYIAYYASQQAGSAAHSPRSCIPGGGWRIKELKTIDIPEIRMTGKPLSTNRLLIQKGDHGQLVYYWFQQRDRLITNEYLVKWYLFWDALTKNRTDGALVRLTTPVSPGEDLQLADQRLITFAREVQPLMDQYIPR